MKDALCRACSFPLLRVNIGFLIGMCHEAPVLRYLGNLWFDAREQDDLRSRGLLERAYGADWHHHSDGSSFAFFHHGREFDHRYTMVFSDPSDHEEPLAIQPADLSSVTRWEIRSAFRQGLVFRPAPLLISKPPTHGAPAEAFAVLEVHRGAYVVGHAKFGAFDFPLIEPRELVKDLAVLDLERPFNEWLVGLGVPIGAEQRAALDADTAGWTRGR